MSDHTRNDYVICCSGCKAVEYIKNFSADAVRKFRENESLHRNHEVPTGSKTIAGEDIESFFDLVRRGRHGENA